METAEVERRAALGCIADDDWPGSQAQEEKHTHGSIEGISSSPTACWRPWKAAAAAVDWGDGMHCLARPSPRALGSSDSPSHGPLHHIIRTPHERTCVRLCRRRWTAGGAVAMQAGKGWRLMIMMMMTPDQRQPRGPD